MPMIEITLLICFFDRMNPVSKKWRTFAIY
jgi:hypothetical protein